MSFFRFACEILVKSVNFVPDFHTRQVDQQVELSSLSPTLFSSPRILQENFYVNIFSIFNIPGEYEAHVKTEMNKQSRFLLFSHLLLFCLWPWQSTISLADDNMVDPVARSIKKLLRMKIWSPPPPFHPNSVCTLTIVTI